MSEHTPTPEPECHCCGVAQGGMVRLCSSCVAAVRRADKRSAMHDRLVAMCEKALDYMEQEWVAPDLHQPLREVIAEAKSDA